MRPEQPDPEERPQDAGQYDPRVEEMAREQDAQRAEPGDRGQPADIGRHQAGQYEAGQHDPRVEEMAHERDAERSEPTEYEHAEPLAEAGREEARPEGRDQIAGEPAAVPEGAEMNGYRARFDTVQAGFIDDPREAVNQAESLVEEAVDRMMDSLHQQLKAVHESIGDGDDTERLRQAMQRYRQVIDSLGDRTSPSRTV